MNAWFVQSFVVWPVGVWLLQRMQLEGESKQELPGSNGESANQLEVTLSRPGGCLDWDKSRSRVFLCRAGPAGKQILLQYHDDDHMICCFHENCIC